MPSPKKSAATRKRRLSPGPRVNLKKLREQLYANTEIAMPKVSLQKAGTRKHRKAMKKMKGLPSNVEFLGVMTRKQAHKLWKH